MDEELRREIILDNYSNPFHKETHNELESANANNSSCIDNITIFLKIDGGVIKEAYFDGEACAISTASTSIMVKNVIGKSEEEAINYINNFENMVNEKAYDNTILKEANAFNEIYKQASRKTCALLPYVAIKKIIK